LNASAIHPEPHFISDLEILVRRIIRQYAAPAEQDDLLRRTDVVFEHATAPSVPLSSDQQRAADEAEAEAKLSRARIEKIKADDEFAAWRADQDRKQAILDKQRQDDEARLARERAARERDAALAAEKAEKEEAKLRLKAKQDAIGKQQNQTMNFTLPIYGVLYTAILGYLAYLIWNYPFQRFGGLVLEIIMIGIFGIIGVIAGLMLGAGASWGFTTTSGQAIAAAAVIVIGTTASALYGAHLNTPTGLLLGVLVGLLVTAIIAAIIGSPNGGSSSDYAKSSPWFIHGDSHVLLSDDEMKLAEEVRKEKQKERDAKTAAQ
jgi:hypothetical protein